MKANELGLTTEVAAIATFLLGAMAILGHTALVVGLRSPRTSSAFQSTWSRVLDTTTFFATPIEGLIRGATIR